MLALIDSKIGVRKGFIEHILIEDSLVNTIFYGACHRVSRDELIFGYNYNHFRMLIRQLSHETGVTFLGYRPYSFRRGGASWEFKLNGSTDRAFHRGRWVSLNAAKLYLTEALASVGTHLLPEGITARYADAKVKLSGFGVVGSRLL